MFSGLQQAWSQKGVARIISEMQTLVVAEQLQILVRSSRKCNGSWNGSVAARVETVKSARNRTDRRSGRRCRAGAEGQLSLFRWSHRC